MTPGCGIQTFYNNDPPEAIVDAITENISHPPFQAVTPRTWRKRIGISVLTALLIAAILGIGLSLGLRQRRRDDLGDTSTHPRRLQLHPHPSNKYIFYNPKISLSVASSIIQATATERPLLKHGIMDGTSIAAFRRGNDRRTLAFQDKTGSICQIIYTNVLGLWQSPQDSQLQPSVVARNNTPLAVYYESNVSTLSLSHDPKFLHPDLTDM